MEYLQIEKNYSPYTVTYYQNDLKTFFEFLDAEGIKTIHDVDQHSVRLYLTTLFENKLSRRTVSRKISSLRSFFHYLEKNNEVQANPIINISLPKTKKSLPSFLYKEELEKLFQVNDLTDPLGQRDQALIELLYATGIRVSECQQLCTDHIDFSVGSLFVEGKGKKERYVLFGQFASEALKLYLQDGRQSLLDKGKKRSRYVFLNARGEPITTRGIRHVLNKIVEKSALTIHIHPHKLRHTFATHMLNEGADLRVVQELLGHENLSSTQIYTHVTKDYLRNIYMNSHPRAKKENDKNG